MNYIERITADKVMEEVLVEFRKPTVNYVSIVYDNIIKGNVVEYLITEFAKKGYYSQLREKGMIVERQKS